MTTPALTCVNDSLSRKFAAELATTTSRPGTWAFDIRRWVGPLARMNAAELSKCQDPRILRGCAWPNRGSEEVCVDPLPILGIPVDALWRSLAPLVTRWSLLARKIKMIEAAGHLRGPQSQGHRISTVSKIQCRKDLVPTASPDDVQEAQVVTAKKERLRPVHVKGHASRGDGGRERESKGMA
eukprot:CAMPEP_0169481864 /NCGR_PEP_ID=MMETSP1042-20121227/30359_1 /TAXON_ID=464988 /ORGANISM="Hemiselmis andersenii, Strain CCMP1180" /LENGTH=182 /DNA_ID=CAMNT_0009596673 /DNA_START=234 /DNA_END=782 /DNA_ORIENTATION=+